MLNTKLDRAKYWNGPLPTNSPSHTKKNKSLYFFKKFDIFFSPFDLIFPYTPFSQIHPGHSPFGFIFMKDRLWIEPSSKQVSLVLSSPVLLNLHYILFYIPSSYKLHQESVAGGVRAQFRINWIPATRSTKCGRPVAVRAIVSDRHHSVSLRSKYSMLLGPVSALVKNLYLEFRESKN